MKKAGIAPGLRSYGVALAARPFPVSRFAPQLLLEELAKACGFLPLLLHAGLFVVGPAPYLRKDAIHHDALVKALEGALEGLVIADDYL